MHLAIVSPYPPGLTGIGQYGYHISRGLARSAAFERITVLAGASGVANPAGHSQEQLAPADVPGLSIDQVWRPGDLRSGPHILKRLLRLKPDLVWFNLGASAYGRSPAASLLGLLTPFGMSQLGIPRVVTLHELVAQADLRRLGAPGGPLAPVGAQLVTYLATRADVVCVTLKRHAEWLANRWPGLKAMHIPHGSFDQPQLLPASEQQELLMFTSYAPFKGLELLLEAFRQLQPRFPGLRLTLAGAEHPRTPGYLAQVRSAFGEHPAVSWRGSIPEEDLRNLFARSHLVVLPYLATTGSSSVMCRAAGWGRALVSSDLPEMKAAAQEAGLAPEYFRSGDAASLARSLEALLLDDRRRQAQVLINFQAACCATLEETCRRYLRAFDLALSNRPGIRTWRTTARRDLFAAGERLTLPAHPPGQPVHSHSEAV